MPNQEILMALNTINFYIISEPNQGVNFFSHYHFAILITVLIIYLKGKGTQRAEIQNNMGKM